MAFNRRAALGGAALAATVAAFAWPRPGNGGFTLSRGDPRVFRRGNSAEPATLDPQKASDVWEDWILGDMFVGLMHQDPRGNPIPAACEKYSASADGLTYTVTLREHKWSDGTEVTADDFVFSFRRIADPKTAAQYVSILYPITGIKDAVNGKIKPEEIGVRAIDPRTLEIKVDYQVPYIDQLLMHQTTYPVPRHVIEKHGDDWNKPENIATNGAFVLKEWISNDHILLVKNPHFFDAANVALDKIYFYPTEDTGAALKRFRAGELDIVNRCPPVSQVPLLRKTNPREVRISPFTATYFLPVNTRKPPFTDPRLRMALSLAVDRETVTDKIMRIGQIPAYNIVPPGMPGYSYGAQMRFKGEPLAVRQEKARALLKEAGYGPNNPLRFDLAVYNKIDWKIMCTALQAMWSQVGIEMTIVPYDSHILFDVLRKKDFQVGSAGWVADYRDPKNFMFLFETSTTDLNYSDYRNPKYDALVANSDFIHDPTARLKALADAEQMALDDTVVITLMHDVTRDMVSPQVEGWIPNVTNFNRSRWLSLNRDIQNA